uniref:Uncharacterized protein n=1 Tax=Anguilla anguilla TaxID=7936 RepID=A0A0E9TEA0_ANGAN
MRSTLSPKSISGRAGMCISSARRSMSLDFMMWVFSAVTFHGPNVKSCLLLLNPWDIMADKRASRLSSSVYIRT